MEALGDCLRIELRPSGARAGVAYYAGLDTDMTARAFATRAAERANAGPHHRAAAERNRLTCASST